MFCNPAEPEKVCCAGPLNPSACELGVALSLFSYPSTAGVGLSRSSLRFLVDGIFSDESFGFCFEIGALGAATLAMAAAGPALEGKPFAFISLSYRLALEDGQ